jgi:hypothetical protein
VLFKEMKAKDRAKLLEDTEDVLGPMIERDEQIYEGVTCPRCGGLAQKDFDLFKTITSNRVIPRYNSKCLECRCVFEPITGIIVELGNKGLLEPETLTPLIYPDDH